MLIKLNRDTWVNFTGDNVNRIDIKQADQLEDEGFFTGDNVNRIDIKQADQLEDKGFIRYYVVIDTDATDYYLGYFQTFEDAESFVLDIVNKLNAEAQHETKQIV